MMLSRITTPTSTAAPADQHQAGGYAPGTERAFRVRRSLLAVPASSERFIEKARGLPVDEVFLDLEDAVAPAAKAQARANAAAAVTGDWGGRLVAVRVNDANLSGH